MSVFPSSAILVLLSSALFPSYEHMALHTVKHTHIMRVAIASVLWPYVFVEWCQTVVFGND